MGDLARLIRRDKCNHMSSYKKEAEGDSVRTERRGSEDGAERDWEAPALKTGAVATRQGKPAASVTAEYKGQSLENTRPC